MANEMKTKRIISIFQLLTALLTFPLFFTFVPWALSEPISQFKNCPEVLERHPPPEWAKYYTIGHGKPVFFRTSPREEPLRAIIYGGSIAGCVGFLIISSLYHSRH